MRQLKLQKLKKERPEVRSLFKGLAPERQSKPTLSCSQARLLISSANYKKPVCCKISYAWLFINHKHTLQ